MQTKVYTGTFHIDLLGEQLMEIPGMMTLSEFGLPTPAYYAPYVDQELTMTVPDSVNLETVDQVIATHNPAGLTRRELLLLLAQQAREGIHTLPEWAAWSADEAQAQVTARVLSGMTKAEADAWIDANITATTLAGLKAQMIAALKILAGGLIDLRGIVGTVAKMVMWLRDILIRANPVE